jgi:hypothetical protein
MNSGHLLPLEAMQSRLRRQAATRPGVPWQNQVVDRKIKGAVRRVALETRFWESSKPAQWHEIC